MRLHRWMPPIALILAAYLTACADPSDSAQDTKIADLIEHMPTMAYRVRAEKLQTMLDASNRPAADRARDEGRKPAEVLSFFGARMGMVVMDVIALGGYYTEALSVAVGPSGKVYAQNPPSALKLNNGAYDKALANRLADGRLGNVVRLNQSLNALAIPPGSLDVIVTALNFHDIVQQTDAEGASEILQSMKRLLKPGGVFGIVDHYGKAGFDNVANHRMDVSGTLPLIRSAGFKVTQSSLLRNPHDDYSKSVFAEGIRGKTDRLVLRLVKP